MTHHGFAYRSIFFGALWMATCGSAACSSGESGSTKNLDPGGEDEQVNGGNESPEPQVPTTPSVNPGPETDVPSDSAPADPIDVEPAPSPEAPAPSPDEPEQIPDEPQTPTPVDPVTEPTVTWHQDIAPIVSERCSGCHRENGIGPFSLETYEQASVLSSFLLAAVEAGIMPPWGARETDECQPRFGFRDDARLSDEQIQLFTTWVAEGSPEGDPQTAAPLTEPPSLELQDPSLSLTLPDVTVEGSSDRFLCFSLDANLADDAWVVGSQVMPGNNAVVHHVLTYIDAAGASAALANEEGYYECFGGPGIPAGSTVDSGAVLLSAWAPGSVPWRAPADVATRLPAGSRLIVNVHYHPTGAGAELDSGTRVDLAFTDTEPAYDGQIVLIGNFEGPDAIYGGLLPGDGDPASGPAFVIPGGATSHLEEMDFKIPSIIPEAIIWAVGTHMHYVGTDMRMTIERPQPDTGEPAEECLIQTPQWDFNWQRGYIYDGPLSELPVAGPLDTIHLRCSYDNSLQNRFVREALDEQGLTEPRDVLLGEETLDEMCLGVFGVAYPR